MRLIIVGIILILTSFLTAFARLIIRRIKENSSFGKRMYAFEPVFILLLWIIVIFWAVYYLFYEKAYYNFIVFALISVLFVSISWFFIKDFMAGIVFKMQNNYSPGDKIQLGNISGTLEALLSTYISIYTDEGKLIKIPYSKISNEIISSKLSGGSFDKNNYTFRVAKTETAEEIRNRIYKLLMNSPWRIKGKKPLISLKSENNESYEFEIQVQTRNEKHFNYVVSFLQKRFIK